MALLLGCSRLHPRYLQSAAVWLILVDHEAFALTSLVFQSRFQRHCTLSTRIALVFELRSTKQMANVLSSSPGIPTKPLLRE